MCILCPQKLLNVKNYLFGKIKEMKEQEVVWIFQIGPLAHFSILTTNNIIIKNNNNKIVSEL